MILYLVLAVTPSIFSYRLGCRLTARIYRRRLKEAKADANAGWAWATEGWAAFNEKKNLVG